ncbi:MAG: hypothetical protein ACHQ4F_00990 [Candidatus Dormibacteria bacterium]
MALPVTTSLVEESAARLAAGGWHYTRRQLYYATCARAETTPGNAASNGEIGLGVLMILIGLILIGIKVLFALFVTLGVALILTGILGRLRRPTVTGRLLALSFDEFGARFGSLDPDGLIPDSVPAAPAAAVAEATIVTDTRDTAALIAANAVRAELGAVKIIVANDGHTPDRGTRAIVLHDASPRGCALVLDLRDAGVEVVDGGLRPREVDGPSHQVIEGAPARLPRDLSVLLDGDEIDWLLSGRRVELATLPSEAVMDRVRAAVSEAPRLRGDAPQPAR